MVKKTAVLEKLLNIIPGFHGYRQKEYLREDDRLIREYMARVLDEARRDFEDAMADLAMYDFGSADRLDGVLRDLRLITDKIRFAEAGYAPHFNIVKITEEDLEMIRSIDASLVEQVEKLRRLAEELRMDVSMGNPVAEKVREIVATINMIRKWLVEREKVTRGWISAGKDK